MAFAGQVSGWFHETVELSAYAGSTIRVAFRVASDCGSYQQPYGEPVIYYVDNVRLSASTAP
jgi:bacillopeptidase F (M6 metalloprotease family)